MGTAHRAYPHESAHLHVTGSAEYVDDIPEPNGTLYAAVGLSERAHARIESLNLDPVLASEGVVAVLTAGDVVGKNNHGPILNDDPIFAEGVVEYVGQVIFAVVATSVRLARRAARKAIVSYQELEPTLEISDALNQDQDLLVPESLVRGDSDAAIANASHQLSGCFAMGGQDHFYLEGQISLAVPKEDGCMQLFCSTQHPSEVQHLVAECLNLTSKDVTVLCRRMGGGFGGKETQPALFACIAALAANQLGVAVKLRVDRDDDMEITGNRHPYEVKYQVGFDNDGVIAGLNFEFASDCGRSADLSGPVNVRTLFHADNCYWLDTTRIESRRLKTNKASNTAFRGFGGPQGMLAIEYVLEDIARHLKVDAVDVRERNYYGEQERNQTPYGMVVEDNIVRRVVDELLLSSDYRQRRETVRQHNRDNQVLKRGLALTPVKFGISFTATHYNQAGALVHVYKDGSILLNHGGTEMGQGLYTKVAQVVAQELGVSMDRLRSSTTDTTKVPNTSATAASAGSDLNGMAARDAAQKIRGRLAELACAELGYPDLDPSAVKFENETVYAKDQSIGFSELVSKAYYQRIQLSDTGFYKTPKIHYDAKTLQGRPFFYFCYGAAVSEVLVDTLTGETKLVRVDILHDVGKSLNPAIDLGQIEGGFMQGVGWLMTEELVWHETGKLMTHAPSTYKIPAATDCPEMFNVEICAWSENAEETIYRSKAVGEPPFMLAMSAFMAVKDALGSCGPNSKTVPLNAPATPEEVLSCIHRLNQ